MSNWDTTDWTIEDWQDALWNYVDMVDTTVTDGGGAGGSYEEIFDGQGDGENDNALFAYEQEEESTLGLTQAQIENIVKLPKGSRPAPSTYLSQDYINTHLAQFPMPKAFVMTLQ